MWPHQAGVGQTQNATAPAGKDKPSVAARLVAKNLGHIGSPAAEVPRTMLSREVLLAVPSRLAHGPDCPKAGLPVAVAAADAMQMLLHPAHLAAAETLLPRMSLMTQQLPHGRPSCQRC